MPKINPRLNWNNFLVKTNFLLVNKYIKYGKEINPSGNNEKGGNINAVIIPQKINFIISLKLIYLYYFYSKNSSVISINNFKF